MSGLRGAMAAGVVALAIWIAAVTPVWAAPYAAIVVDARSGEVLHARSADRKLHPASLTKMMTLYMAFEAIRDGRIRLDQKVRISAHAARQVPSKMGFRRGQRVRIRDLIRATAVKSANDAAVALGEAISKSESAFAKAMTRRARQLGMRNTTFRNASGLTHSGQRSTARDMALLGRRLFYDFPQYYNLFGRVQTKVAGRTVYSTNRKLLRSYRGADGIKTGYTRAAGYNLVSSAERGSKRIIAVVFGGRTGAWRNARIAELLNMGFARAPAKARVKRPTTYLSVKSSPPPKRRPDAAGVALAQAKPAPAAPAPAPTPVPAAFAKAPAAPAPKTISAETEAIVARVATELGAAIVTPAAASTPKPSERSFAPARSPSPELRPGPGAKLIRIAAPSPRPRPGRKVAKARAKGDWAVQLGVFAREETAIAELALAALSDIEGLDSAGRDVKPTRLSGRPAYRARLTGLDRASANGACAALKVQGRDCLAVAPRR